ncbi:MAG TPA: RNA polymerase sigma-70 factor [Arachidicoccus sp.]
MKTQTLIIPIDNRNDTELLSLIKSDEDAAFAALYKRYARLLLNKAYDKLEDKNAAADIVHDVFVAFYLNREKLPDNVNIAAYLHTAVRNKTLNELRNRQVREKGNFEYVRTLAPVVNQEPDGAHEQLEQQLNLHLAKVPQKHREAFILSRYENLSYREISDRMGISVKTVESYISKVLKFLRANMDHHFFWYAMLGCVLIGK